MSLVHLWTGAEWIEGSAGACHEDLVTVVYKIDDTDYLSFVKRDVLQLWQALYRQTHAERYVSIAC